MISLKHFFKRSLCCALILNNSLLIFPTYGPPVKAEELNRARVVLEGASNYDLENLLVFYEGEERPTLIKVDPASVATTTIQNDLNRHERSITDKRKKLENKFNELLRDPKVEHVQPQYIYTATDWSRNGNQDTPDDFDTNGASNHWYYDFSHVREMWQDQDCLNAGAGCGGDSDVIVAVIDTGLAYENRTNAWGDTFAQNDDMFGANNINLYTNTGETPNNQIDDDGNGYVDDYHGVNTADYVYCDLFYSCNAAQLAEVGHANDDGGHGTFVTGLIASVVDNGAHSVSPAHNISIMPIKASFFHSGSFGSFELWQAIDYAVNEGADVINMSLAGPTFDQGLNDKLEWAKANGVVSVAASGNTNTTVYYPAAFDSVIAVGAVTASGARTFYSNYGSALDVVAFVGNGGGVGDTVWQRSYECFNNSPNCYSTNVYTSFENIFGIGTSYASPQVAGLVGLLKSAKSTISYQGILNKLYGNTIDLGPAGWDQDTGYGAINFEAAYAAVANNVAPVLTLIEPDASPNNADTSFTITWSDSDPDDDAIINLFWDTDASGTDGTAIEFCSNLSENSATNSCVFDTRGLAAGTYYVYGCIYDYVNSQVCSYAPGSITVSHVLKRDWGVASVTTDYVNISFSQSFDAAPVVFAQVSSENGTDKVYTRIKDVTTSGFKVKISENTKAGYDGAHMNENISWYAVQSTTAAESMGATYVDTTVTPDWKQITFPFAFASAPKVFAATQSEVGTDMVTTNIKDVTTTGFKVKLEEPPGWDGAHTKEVVGWIAFIDNSDGQEGFKSTNHNWSSVSFAPSFSESPALISYINTEAGTDPADVDVMNLTQNGFDVRVEEDPRVQDGAHGSESIAWAAFPITTITSLSGTSTIDHNWTQIPFSGTFSVIPKVFAEIRTENGPATAEVDIRNITLNSFEARIEEDIRAGWDGSHATETISWLAMTNAPSGEQLQTQILGTSWTTINFSPAFSGIPKVFAEIQTENGTDTVALDIRNITATSFDIRLEEDIGAGWDGLHTNETVAWFAFESAPFSGSSGTISVNHDWTPVSFGTTFSTIPKVIGDVQSDIGSDTVNIDIRNVTTTGCEVRVEEEALRYDGLHTTETIAWFAWE